MYGQKKNRLRQWRDYDSVAGRCMAWTGVLEYKSGYDNTAFICMLNAVKGMNKMKSIRILLILGCAVCLAGCQKTKNENGKPHPENKISEANASIDKIVYS